MWHWMLYLDRHRQPHDVHPPFHHGRSPQWMGGRKFDPALQNGLYCCLVRQLIGPRLEPRVVLEHEYQLP